MPAHSEVTESLLSELPKRSCDLEPGLLVFFARPSPLQTWAELFGHQWRHVGVTIETDAGLQVASYCMKKCFRTDNLEEIVAAYNRVGVARAFHSDDERREFERFCRQFEFLERSDSPYALSGILVGPVLLLARRCRPGILRRVLFRLIRTYCQAQTRRYHDRCAYLCSTFAWKGIDVARERPLRVPLSAHPEDYAAYATPTNADDDLLAQWLCGPTEIWEAIGPADRAELILDTTS